MSDFSAAIDYVLENEGGYSNDPDDPGGATNFGVTISDLWLSGRRSATPEDIESLTRAEAIDIIYRLYWLPDGLDYIQDQRIATKCLDTILLRGRDGGTRIIQRACRGAGQPTPEDGRLGPATMAAINACDPDALLAAMACASDGVYRMIAARNPRLDKFLAGWLNRAYRQPVAESIAHG